MEAQEIFPVRNRGVLTQESAPRGMIDVFQNILHENEARRTATRGETARTDAPRDRVERDADRVDQDTERTAIARRRSDAAQESRNGDRYSDMRDARPAADDTQTTVRSDRRDRPDDSPPRTERPDQGAEPATATDTQRQDDAPINGDTPAEPNPGDEGAQKLATPASASDQALAGNTAIFAPAIAQIADGVGARTPAANAALKPANPKAALNNAPLLAVMPTTAAGAQGVLDGAVASPVLSGAETAAAAKANQSTVPVVPAEAGIPLGAARIKRPQGSGQKAGAPTASAEALEVLGTPVKEKLVPTAVKNRADQAGRKTVASAASPAKRTAAQTETNQAARTNPVLVPPSLANPGQAILAVNGTAAEALKTAASAGNIGQTQAGLNGIDPMQTAARGASARPGLTPATNRPVPPNEVAVNIQRAAARGEDRIRIRLHPAELGQIDVRLKVGADGILRAMIQVDRPETLDFMQRDARGLERALQDAGLKTDSGSLSFNLRNNGEDGLQDRDGDGDASMAGGELADVNSSAATDAAETPIHTGWSNRVLDIRV